MADPEILADPESPSSGDAEDGLDASPEKAPKTCYQRAVDLLARRAHFDAELRFKLVKRGFDDEEVDGALMRLRQEGYVDDEATARLWLEQQLARKPQGPSKLLAGLLRRGVDGDVARAAVRELTTGHEDSLAENAARRYLARSGRVGRAGLARRLDRLGFPTGVVLRVLRRFGDELSGP